ncbi:SH3 domain-containing protein [Citrobacter freundii]|uniref:SH3 domain-containing protein n=1 Tax=Citrobacter freundii TaxID=546 RepID=UPI0028DA728A|nr:SH3 domain-containing protein [Citrobacter freundii]ELR9594028.1 SH3 domain-containing protein [Citrobacter freundii]HEH9868046.1 SH3 domain-containing protein [Citrobacter freundii]
MKKQPTDIKNSEENESSDITDNQDERRISDELRKQLEASDLRGSLSKTLEEYHQQNSLSAIVRKHSEELQKNQTEKNEKIRKQLFEMQKQGSFGSLYKQIENIQKQAGFGGSLHKQMEDIQKKAGFSGLLEGIHKQASFGGVLEGLQKQANFGGVLEGIHKQASFSGLLHKQPSIAWDLSRQTKELFQQYNLGSMVSKQFEQMRKQLIFGSQLRSQFDEAQKLSGLNSAGSLLKDLQRQSGLFDSTNSLKQFNNIFHAYAKENNASLSYIMELGMSSVAKAYSEGVLDAQNEAVTQSDSSLSPSSNNDYANFLNLFKALPQPIQFIIYTILTQIFLGALIDYGKGKVLIEINRVEKYFESIIDKKPVTRTDILKENKNIDWDSLNNFRIITGENVRLREKPSMKSEVIETIGKNTVVAILDKSGRQWLYVQVQSGDELITGWITRTYTKPIKG